MLIVKGLLTKEEVAQILERCDSEEFVDGRQTARMGAKEVKKNLQLPHGGDAQKDLDQIIRAAFKRSDVIREVVMPVNMMPMRFSRYEEGMEYGWHVDAHSMTNPRGQLVRTDLASTVFLVDADSYDGGELTIRASTGTVSVKLNAGDAVVYPATTVHRVETVTRGARQVAVTWIQSLVGSAEKRQVLFELISAIADLRGRDPKSPEITQFSAVHRNLVRMWGQP